MATKIDFKGDLDCHKAKRGTPQVVEVPGPQYLMIAGHGDPKTSAFFEATTTIYPVAYKPLFASKKTLDRDRRRHAVGGIVVGRRYDDMEFFTDARTRPTGTGLS